MSKQKISIVNGVEIFAEINEKGNVFVPIKPICAALGIADNKQREKILEDDILASVGTLRVSTGVDGKQYEMFCLPLEYVYGWIFTINPKNVADSAKEAVKKYRRECYEVLYRHFAGTMKKQIEANEAEIEYLKAINEAISREKEAKADRIKAEKALANVRASRLDSSPTLEFE